MRKGGWPHYFSEPNSHSNNMNNEPFMKKYILYVFFILTFFDAKSQENKTSSFEIHFQDFFVNDTVCLSINQYSILNKKVLTSNLITGLTTVIVRIYLNKGSGLIKMGKDSITINKISTPIKIKVSLNGRLSKFKISLEHGKYIGLDKRDNNKFGFYQSKNPFEYD